MPLVRSDIHEYEMYQPILRLFQRWYIRGYGRENVYVRRPYAELNDIPDVVYYRAYNQIHVVEAKRSALDIYDAVYQLRRYRGNYKYLALPDGEYYEYKEDVDELIEDVFGLILVGIKGSGLYADCLYDPPKYEGDFSRYYEYLF